MSGRDLNKDFVKLYRNLVWCEDTHGLAHRLYDKWGEEFPGSKFSAQMSVMDTLYEIEQELFKDEDNKTVPE